MKEYLFVYIVAIVFIISFIYMDIKTIIPSKRFTNGRIATFIGLSLVSFFIYYKSREIHLLLPLLVISVCISFYKTGIQEKIVMGNVREWVDLDKIAKAVIRHRKDELLVSVIGNKGSDANLKLDYKYEDKIYDWLNNNNISIVEK